MKKGIALTLAFAAVAAGMSACSRNPGSGGQAGQMCSSTGRSFTRPRVRRVTARRGKATDPPPSHTTRNPRSHEPRVHA